MRRKLAAAGLALALASQVALADVVDECQQNRRPEVNPEISLRACTEIIESPTFGPDAKAFAYRYRGEAHTDAGATGPAIADFTESIRLKKDNVSAFEGRGRANFTARHLAQSIADYGEAIRLSPASAELYIERGHVYTVSGNTEAAIRDLTEAIRLNPFSARAFNERGVAYAKGGDPVRSQEDYTAGIALFPFPELYLNRGYVREGEGRTKEAIDDFRHALLNDPSLVEASDALKRLGVVDVTTEADRRVREGEALALRNCVSCHAVGAKDSSADKNAPAFRALYRRHPLFALRTPITRGIRAAHAQMRQFAAPDEEIDMIVAYINSLSPRR